MIQGTIIYVELSDGQNGGIAVDISESGLMLQAALRISGEQVSRLRFKLPGSEEWIQARGNLVWMGKSGKEAGVQFVGLPENCRATIAEYVAREDLGDSLAAMREEQFSGERPREQVDTPPAREATAPDPPVPATERSFGDAAASARLFRPQPQPGPRPNDSFPAGSRGWRQTGETAAARASGSAQQKEPEPENPKRPPREQPPPTVKAKRRTGDATLPWWGLSRVVFWMAVAFLATFFGFRYFARSLQSSMPGRRSQSAGMSAGMAQPSQSSSANAAARGATARQSSPTTSPAQSPAVSPNSPAGNPVPNGSMANQTVPGSSTGSQSAAEASMNGQLPADPFVLGNTSALGDMATQSLPANAAGAAASRSSGRSLRRVRASAPHGRQPSDGSIGAPAQAADPAHDALLVGAPPIGAAPERAILERIPVSASTFIAVMMSRSILVSGSHDSTEQVQLGKLISYVKPNYPNAALEREVQGAVRVRAFIGPEGNVFRVQLLSGSSVLAGAAMSAIRAWRFGTTLLNGQPIQSQADVNIFFRLH